MGLTKGLSKNIRLGSNVNQNTIPEFINDGNTVDIWSLDSGVVESGNKVSSWIGTLNNISLNQAVEALQPTLNGDYIAFDNTGLKTSTFTLVQPEYMYMVVRVNNFSVGKITDGGSNYRGCVQLNANRINMWAGSDSTYNTNWQPVSRWVVIRALFNGANSKLIINEGDIFNGNPGVGSMNGFTLGGVSNMTGFAKFDIKEIIIRKSADSDADSLLLCRYLKRKYNIEEYFFDKAKLIFTFDDGLISQYSNLYPILQAQGITATIFCSANKWGTSKYMTAGNAKVMSDNGVDIQCHTFDHIDLELTSTVDTTTDLVANNTAFENANIPLPTEMAYPWGKISANSLIAVKELRKTGRRIGVPPPATSFTILKDNDLYGLPCHGIDYPNTLATVQSRITDIIAKRGALILYAHGIDDTSYGDASITSELLNQMIDYAQTQNLDIISMKMLRQLF